ncbi:MAG: ABC transporter substrate-binding protein [Nocardiopsaceae bacterium]|nr:ABC transporter substrate-binding protein [Nocardiopsaceae bacterium]
MTGAKTAATAAGAKTAETAKTATTAKAVGTASGAKTATAAGPTLRVEAQTAFSTFNPFTAYFDGDLEVIEGIYPMLLQTSESGNPVAYLATKWSPSPDHLTWTFTLRPGLRWSDGQPLTARDVAWTYNLIMHDPAAGTANGSLVANFASVTAPDPDTVVIKTVKPQANLPYIVAGPTGIPVVPEHVWASKVKNLASFRNQGPYPVVGYGPWILTGYVPNQYATLKANNDFYAGAPAYKTLIVQYYTSSDAAVAALRTGALDEIGDGNLTATQFNALKHVKGVSVYPTRSNAWEAIEVNTGARTKSGQVFGNGNPILKDPAVRKAIALAIDRKELVSKVLDGLGVPGAGYLTPAYPQWQWKPPASADESYDPARANQILNAAGYRKNAQGVRVDPKTRKPLAFRLGIHSDEATDQQIAPYLVEWLQAIGIKLDTQSMSFDQLNAALPKGDWDMLLDVWSQTPDPSYLFSIQTCGTLPASPATAGNTDAFFCDPAFDKLYTSQQTQFSQQRRRADTDRMQSILYTANVDIMLFYADILDAVRTADVRNYMYGAPDAQGFYPLEADYLNWLRAKPASGSGGGGSLGLEIGIPVAVVVVIGAGVIVVLRRRRTAADRE